MSRASSPRAARLRDWDALRRAIEAERRRSDFSTCDADDQHRYLDALQRTLEGRAASELLSLLGERVPVSPTLLPVVAEVIRDLLQGGSNGRPTKLTDADHARIRHEFDADMASSSMTAGQARQILADRYGVSSDTIRRSLAKTRVRTP